MLIPRAGAGKVEIKGQIKVKFHQNQGQAMSRSSSRSGKDRSIPAQDRQCQGQCRERCTKPRIGQGRQDQGLG